MLSSWLLLTAASVVQALDIDISSHSSVCGAAGKLVAGTLDYYDGTRYGGTVGMFQEPYYWWQAGEAFGSLLDYNHICNSGDDKNKSLESLIYNGITSQLGDNHNLMVQNFSTSEGNDDQGVWALTIMSAAEKNFPAPSGSLSWGQVAANIFNVMFNRWDSECKGGIRWQIFRTNNNGYGYKNTISNGALFTLAARLGRYYNINRFLYAADFIWEWTASVGFLVEDDASIVIYDGGNIEHGCQDKTDKHWSYNYGIYLLGASYLYNVTGDDIWLLRVQKLVSLSADLFFKDDILLESQCQTSTKITCNNDQRSFKALFARCLAGASVLVPQVSAKIDSLIQSSAKAAAKSCSGGIDGHTCGLDWTQNKWDGLYGLGEELSALETIQNVLIHHVAPPNKAFT